MNFRIKAAGRGGTIVTLNVAAKSQEIARQQAVRDGYAVLSVHASRQFLQPRAFFKGSFSLTVFSQELLALLDAGMTQVEALETIIEEDGSPTSKRMLKDILDSLYEGHTFSKSLENFPDTFPKIYTELIRASEKTGNVSDSLKQYITYQTRIEAIRKKIINASIYPAILLTAGFLVCLFLILYVVPKFSLVYQEMGQDLPLFSRLLMQWGSWLNENAVLFLFIILSTLSWLIYKISHKGVTSTFIDWVSKIPMLGRQIKIHHLALFYRTISILLKSGINIVPAMAMVEGILRSDLQASERNARQAISEGQSVSQSMHQAGLTTPIGYKLLRVGEKSGKLDELTEKIADFYDEDVSRWLEWFTKLFEPILMAIIGTVIGLIVVMMYFPIFEIAGNIQ